MIKVAILGWLRFLPVGAIALPEWGGVLASGGLLSLFYALPIGMVQSDPKAILAYSSISKMGFLMLSLGLIMMEPALAPVGIAGVAFYAANHALVKGGLFLSVGLRKHAALTPSILQPFILGAMVFLALALVGAPFTSGASAKYAMKPVLEAEDWPWLSAVLAVSTVGTSLLMVRFIWVSARTRTHDDPGYLWPTLSWGLLLALVALFPFVLGKAASWLTNSVTVPIGVALGGLIALTAWTRPRWLAPAVGCIPPGDLIVPVIAVGRRIATYWQRVYRPIERLFNAMVAPLQIRFLQYFATPEADQETGLRRWPIAGGLWIGLIILILIGLFSSNPALTRTPTARNAPGSSHLSDQMGQRSDHPSSTLSPAAGSPPAPQAWQGSATVPIPRTPAPCALAPAPKGPIRQQDGWGLLKMIPALSPVPEPKSGI
jgi:NADH:ubiquinone oxidoreductase subunit 5 (subunit L)/multisubunit Na+/H+ antiporter MnhA subunit